MAQLCNTENLTPGRVSLIWNADPPQGGPHGVHAGARADPSSVRAADAAGREPPRRGAAVPREAARPRGKRRGRAQRPRAGDRPLGMSLLGLEIATTGA